MSSTRLLTNCLAARNMLESQNARLLDWTERQWQRWLERERSGGGPTWKSSLVLVAALTCLDDLRLHVGLMQLLQLREVRAAPILTFPGDDALNIASAEARREGWQALVVMIADAQLPAALAELEPDQHLAVFRQPVLMTEAELSAVEALLKGSDSAKNSKVEHMFIGLARDWRPQGVAAGTASLARLAVADAEVLGEACPVEEALKPVAEMSRVNDLRLAGGKIDLPVLGRGDELLVMACQDDKAEVIAHLAGRLAGGQRQVRVRVPAPLLTTVPQRVLIELRRAEAGSSTTNLEFFVPPSRIEPWMLSAFLNRGGAGNPVVHAFALGTGCRLAYAEDEPEILRDIPVVWGVLRQSDRILDQAKRQSLYFFYIDHAYFDRGHGKSYRIARNSYEAGPVRICPSDRFQALNVQILPWRKGGREIIVCPPTEYFMQAHGCQDWLETTLAKLEAVTDRPVMVRTKPKPDQAAVPLAQALESAHAVVTHSSNVAIEAACLGIPVFVSPTSAAAPVGLTDLDAIETPVYPDREPWLAHLAYNQFSFEEIGDGRAWNMLRELEERDLA